MTGVEYRVMRFTNIALAALMLSVTAGSVQAATTATATLTINVTFTQPTCKIEMPASYNLGFLTPGETKSHGDLNITWKCEGNTPVKTALAATIVTGTANGNEKVNLVTGGGQDTGAALSLREKNTGNPIKLTGLAAKDYFCADPNEMAPDLMRTCTLTPVTEVARQGALGRASATLRFEVDYP
ncbi:TPA: F18 fimbrial protein FedE [Salmonella enterica subsp. enterica serovar Poona]|nr:F18 fimbrial protein FedE [Salmonella enterica subsp. enterica serovar Poona]